MIVDSIEKCLAISNQLFTSIKFLSNVQLLRNFANINLLNNITESKIKRTKNMYYKKNNETRWAICHQRTEISMHFKSLQRTQDIHCSFPEVILWKNVYYIIKHNGYLVDGKASLL